LISNRKRWTFSVFIAIGKPNYYRIGFDKKHDWRDFPVYLDDKNHPSKELLKM
jgi:hypothetical protein